MIDSMFSIVDKQWNQRLILPFKDEVGTYKKMLVGYYLKAPKDLNKKNKLQKTVKLDIKK